MTREHPADHLEERLRRHGITPTQQRLDLARLLLERPAHFSADELYLRAREEGARVSRATVYNTLKLFVDRGLIRQVLVDPSRVFYDSNTRPHHHFYDTDSGHLTDVESTDVDIVGLPELPRGKEVEGVDVIVRVRKSR